jgi:peptidoglycan/xylan/chitin deacetylase (PgdA/CDA1 family)
MKVVMYHYVREYCESFPNFRFLDIDNFRRQLDFFAKSFDFVTRSEWRSALSLGALGSAKGKVLLTFDDALSCHFDYVLPELQLRDLWGIFYVPTKPYSDKKMLDVHKIHQLCGAYRGDELLDVLLGCMSKNMIRGERIQEFERETYVKQQNESGVSEFKRILNYYVNQRDREYLIDKVAGVFNHPFNVEGFYATEENLRAIHATGNIVGSHTVNHPVMSKLDTESQLKEIIGSFNCLARLGCLTEKTYCHPYGGSHSFNAQTIKLLDQEMVHYSFNVDSREIDDDDLILRRQSLPRFDCNEFPFGKAS